MRMPSLLLVRSTVQATCAALALGNLPTVGQDATPTKGDSDAGDRSDSTWAAPSGTTLKEELGALGEDVKAAVVAELIPRAEAKNFYEMLAELITQTRGFDTADRKRSDEKIQASRDRGGMTFTQFELDLDDQRFETLLNPEFTRRDLAILSDAMGDDRRSTGIAETLLDDYLTAFEVMRRDTLEAVSAIRSARRLAHTYGLLEQIQERRIDWPTVDEKVENWFPDDGDGKGGNAARRKTMQWLEERIVHLDSTIGRYERLLERQRERLERPAGDAPARTMVVVLEDARTTRRHLRARAEEGLLAMDSSGTSDEIARALERLRFTHGTKPLRFSGSDVEPWTSIEELDVSRSIEDRVLEIVASHMPSIVELMDERDGVAIDREIKMAELSDSSDQAGRQQPLRDRIADAFQRELRIDLQIREEIRSMQSEVAEALEREDRDLAWRFEQSCRNAAFPSQMRERWSERAIATALAIPDLDDGTLEDLLTLEATSSAELAELRNLAIQTRLQNEPVIAEAMIDMLRGDESTVKELGDVSWRESRHEDFDRFEEQRAAMLRSILGNERFETLPARPKRWGFGGKNADKQTGAAGKRGGGGK